MLFIVSVVIEYYLQKVGVIYSCIEQACFIGKIGLGAFDVVALFMYMFGGGCVFQVVCFFGIDCSQVVDFFFRQVKMSIFYVQGFKDVSGEKCV